VAAENDAAQALYALCGYTLAGERSGYYRRKDGSRIDAVLMRKALT
jgi:ribosomal-protein-alanine N-acetyltransferase